MLYQRLTCNDKIFNLCNKTNRKILELARMTQYMNLSSCDKLFFYIFLCHSTIHCSFGFVIGTKMIIKISNSTNVGRKFLSRQTISSDNLSGKGDFV